MTRHQNQLNRTLLRTGLPALFLIILFLPGPAWADCEIVSFRKYLDKKYSGIDAIVIAKAGPVVDTRSTFMIADGFNNSWHYDGEIRTNSFSDLRYLMGEGPEKIKVEGTYWDTINGEKVDPSKENVAFVEGKNYLLFLRPMADPYFENVGCSPLENSAEAKLKMFFLDVYLKRLDDTEVIQRLWKELSQFTQEVKFERGKYSSGEFPRHKILQRLLQITERELKHIPYYPLKIMTEIFGLLAERNEKFEKILFEHFKEFKSRSSASSESEIKRHRNWALLLASALSWFHKESVNEVLIPYLAEELKGPDSRRAEYVLSNIGTEAARIETRKHYIGK